MTEKVFLASSFDDIIIKNFNNMKKIYTISLFVIFIFLSFIPLHSCEELDESLDEINNEFDNSSNDCHIPWTGRWSGTSDSEDFKYGKKCSGWIEININLNSNDGRIYVSSRNNSSQCVRIIGSGSGACKNNFLNATYLGSEKYEFKLNRSGDTISGELKHYEVDSSGNTNLIKNHIFTVTKQ